MASPSPHGEKSQLQKREGDSSLSEQVPSANASFENINAKLKNPLAGLTHAQLIADGESFAKSHDLGHLTELFQKGALVAQNPLAFETLPLLTDEDKEVLRREVTHRWDQPKMLYYLVILCSSMLVHL